MDVQSTNQFLSHGHSIKDGLSTAVMLKPMRTVSYQAEQHANKSGAINSNSAKLTMLNAEMVLGLNFQHASKAAQLQQAKPVSWFLFNSDVQKGQCWIEFIEIET